MKSLHICGDSFAHPDPASSVIPWFELLKKSLGLEWNIKNLSIVCASNFHIRLQVDTAIAENTDFVILIATSCTRGHGRLQPKSTQMDLPLLQRFANTALMDLEEKDFGCYSLNSLNETCVFNRSQQEILQNYRQHIFDIELEILQNQFLIESSLNALKNHSIDFVFDQGGFEHPKFSSTNQKYFQFFDQHRSKINLWDYVRQPFNHRPFFHITDQKLHEKIADYYFHLINQDKRRSH